MYAEMKPVDAIKGTLVRQGFSQPARSYEEKLIDVGTKVRYLYEPGELEEQQYGGERRRRSTAPLWSVDVCKIKDRYIKNYQPTLYYLDGEPKRSFVFDSRIVRRTVCESMPSRVQKLLQWVVALENQHAIRAVYKGTPTKAC